MSLIYDIKAIQKEIERIKNINITENKYASATGIANANTNTLFASLEVRKKSNASLIQIDNKTSENVNAFITKKIEKNEKRKIFRVTYLRTVIPYLDIKAILNISLLNKEFSYFIKSVYIYKFIEIMRMQKLKNKIKEDKIKTPKKTNNIYSVGNSANVNESSSATKVVGSLFGAITGAFSVFGFGSSSKFDNKNINIDPKLMEEKLNSYEKILLKKLDNSKINVELKELRDSINSVIDNRKKKTTADCINAYIEVLKSQDKSQLLNQKNSLTDRMKSFIVNDEEYEKIRREKMEKEYCQLIEEIKDLKEEDRILKNSIKMLENEEIDKVKVLSNIKNLMNTNSVLENIQYLERENFKSGKNKELKIFEEN